MGRTGAVSFNSNNSHTSLIAGWIAAVAVKAACGLRLIKSAVRIIRLHGVGVFRTDSVDLRFKERLVIVAGKRGGLVVLDKGTLAAAFFSAADLHGLRCLHHERLIVAARSES